MPDPDPAPAQHCETCQYWGARRPAFNMTMLRTCGCPALVHGYHIPEVLVDPRDDLAVIEDWEGWGLLTGPQFGCLHWQVRAGEEGASDAETAPPAAAL